MSSAANPVGCGEAALALARRLDLPATRADVLHRGANALVHLAPTPVVARVARLTARARPAPGLALAREVHFARWLAGAGAAVLPPTDIVDAGPHLAGGWHASLWPWLDLGSDAHVTGAPEVVARALAALHEVCVDYPAERLPGLSEVVADAGRALASVGEWLPIELRAHLESGVERARLGVAAVDALAAGPGGRRALHGDAHPRNLLRVGGGGVLWCDLEDAVSAPVEWDLAVMGRSVRHDGAAAVRAYAAATGRRPDRDLLAELSQVRGVQGACWQLLYADDDPSLREDAVASVRGSWG